MVCLLGALGVCQTGGRGGGEGVCVGVFVCFYGRGCCGVCHISGFMGGIVGVVVRQEGHGGGEGVAVMFGFVGRFGS